MSEDAVELERLLAACVVGDRDAFAALYKATSSRVFGLAMRMLGNRDQASDLLQDVYVRIWTRAGEYHAERGSVLAWVMSIARYRALDMIRFEGRRSPGGEAKAEPAASMMADASSLASSLALQECLDTLADSQRSSILTVFFDGLTHDELAAREQQPLGTVKSRIRRGLKRLKDCLDA